mgnify:CR=1 FL=1
MCISHQLHGSFRAVFIGKKEKKTKKAFFVSESIWVDYLAMLGGHKITTRKRRGTVERWSVKSPGLVRLTMGM